MRNLVDDLKKVRLLEKMISFDRIYKSSNEYLAYIFKNLDIKDKKVLSVLASSDQVFLFYYYQALKVDTFDTNGLTFYYYFLRKWCIEKGLSIYPYYLNSKILKDVISDVQPQNQNELLAKNFWYKVFEEYNNVLNSNMFFRSSF